MKPSPEALSEWRVNFVTQYMVDAITALRREAEQALGRGETLNESSMEATFSATAKIVGVISGLDEVVNLMMEDTEDEIET